MLTKREEGQLYAAMQAAYQGDKVFFFTRPSKIKHFLHAVEGFPFCEVEVELAIQRVSFPRANGFVQFVSGEDENKLMGIEPNAVFADDTSTIPKIVLPKIRKRNVKN